MKHKRSEIVNKILIFIYGLLAYLIALIGQILFILYLTKLDIRNIYLAQEGSLIYSIFIDTLLVLLFALQHSIMARGWFKDLLCKFIPKSMERSTYVLFSGLVFILIYFYWQPIDGTIWRVDNPILESTLWIMFVSSWIFSVVATFVINHFELFGLQQIYFNLIDKTPKDIEFKERFFYKFIRHPIQLGVLMGLWFTPIMSLGHFIFSLLFTIYIFVGLYFEERDLISELGDVYIDYKSRVGLMFPKI